MAASRGLITVFRKAIRFSLRYLRVLRDCLHLFTLGFLHRKHRELLFAIERHFDASHARGKLPVPQLPKIRLREIVKEEFPVRILAPEYRRGNLDLSELLLLLQVVRQFHPDRIFEIGTYDGRTTLNLAANTPEETKIFTLDLPPEKSAFTKLPVDPGDRELMTDQVSGSRFRGRPEERKITQLFGDSASFNFSPFFGTIDFVFVDGSHSYEYALNDSRVALKLLREGKGIIIWDDYGALWAGVTRALDKLQQKDPLFRDIKQFEGTHLACTILK